MANPTNILIYGATSAIAQSTARLWATKGDSCFALVGRSADRLSVVRDDLLARGAKSAMCITADMLETKAGFHQTIFDQALHALGTVEIVLVAHGTLSDQEACARDFAIAETEMRGNFLSYIGILGTVANYMEKRRAGKIIAISSVAGDRGRQSNYYYGAAKAGVTAFLQGLRNRLAPAGIQVLTVKPGFIDTPMTAHIRKGPLFVSPDVAARAIVRAGDHGCNVVYVPGFWRFIMLIICHIPERIFMRMKL
jgi:decaprenylphospho-beta-D-erythro-pentofuranosid-2-ulose 2-reductase